MTQLIYAKNTKDKTTNKNRKEERNIGSDTRTPK